MPKKTAELVAREAELFKSMARAALKARASRLEPGKNLQLGAFEFIVEEDEYSGWIVIITSQPREYIENLASEMALESGLDLRRMNDKEKEEWLIQFYRWLKDLLRERYEIVASLDRGYKIDFEMPAYRKEKTWR
jgi:hypothetical protein